MAILDERGHEILDPMPKEIPIEMRRSEPIHMRIRRMILEEASRQHEGYESFEDADDFDIGDDTDFSSPYEENFDHITGSPTEIPEETPQDASESTETPEPAKTSKKKITEPSQETDES